MFYREGRAILVVFDLTNPKSLEDARGWVTEVRATGRPEAVFIGVANKLDLFADRRITRDQIQDFQYTMQLVTVIEVSAKSGQGVRELVDKLAEHLSELPPLASASIYIASEDTTKGCCELAQIR
jgi:GTPase SAR1 family protein